LEVFLLPLDAIDSFQALYLHGQSLKKLTYLTISLYHVHADKKGRPEYHRHMIVI